MNYTLLLVLQGAVLLGITSGALGTFALLRQQSLLGDAISHAALPGIVLMFLLTHSKDPWILLCGGALAGVIGVVSMNYIVAHTTLKKDAILGIILSVFFGLGLVLMTVAQKIPVASQAILNKFLFGNVATLLKEDMYVIALISFFIFAILTLFWKECAVYVFDPVFTQSIGFNVKIIEVVLTMLLVLAIVIGLQTVGVVLMSTMLIAPAAAARQWTTKLLHMVVLAGIFGGCAATIGVYASSVIDHVPTGPAIVVAASIIVLFSLICAPKRSVA
ncbi:MAG TPA: metal ABC transporter permease [Candidatus Babeliales bacterium]|nr:metal ABC transporter permease [Candidatus Babeliales bacterium]